MADTIWCDGMERDSKNHAGWRAADLFKIENIVGSGISYHPVLYYSESLVGLPRATFRGSLWTIVVYLEPTGICDAAPVDVNLG